MFSNTIFAMLGALFLILGNGIAENINRRVGMMIEMPPDLVSADLLKETKSSTSLSCIHRCLANQECQYVAFCAATALCLLYQASAFAASVLLPNGCGRLYKKDQKFTPPVRNVAVGKSCVQIATGWGGVCERAIDGNTNSDYYQGFSCSHTATRANPWWRVDLGFPYLVMSVTVVDRSDAGAGGLTNYDIRIGNSLTEDGNKNAICVAGVQYIPQITRTFKCLPPRVGRYVNVQIISSSNILWLCEVIVSGF